MSIFKRQYYWHAPQPDILQGSSTPQQESITDSDYIAMLFKQAGVDCITKDCTNGAQITTYHFNLTDIKDYPRINKAAQCVASALYTQCRIVTSDHANFAIEIAKRDRRLISLYDVIATKTFNTLRNRTSAAIGADNAGNPVIIDIAKMPHVLVAGATGSGKSVALNTILCSMLYSACPTATQFVLIDPKQVELSAYAGLPHLACPIITSTQAAISTLESINAAMDKRYKLMAKKRVNNIYQTDMPRIVVVIDELADLMLTSKRAVEESIIRIAQLGRAAGIHLLIATQKPVVSVVTGLIQGNIPCKLALQTASTHDSVRILGHKGAESLLGKGDALLKLPDRVNEIRIQCAYTSDQDVTAVVNYWRYNAKQRV